ncbi:MAG: TRC40/GET3/ArsA family transport-energizing ATPase, partial [Chloroflexota bacterium]|nr:TRC40/GET3/ArsA family transport-energizing ATPase [Chloroflexota bacterium]
DEVIAEEMTVLPGMDELGSLLWIGEHDDSGAYDVIVVDAAPTGETLRLLALPEAARWWVDKLAPIGRRITRLAGPLVNRVIGVPIPDDRVFDAGEELLIRLEHMHELLADPKRTSVRVVLTLEKVVIKEAERSFTFLHLYGYPIDLVVANRLLPSEAGYLTGWYRAQQRYRPMVEDAFAPVPVRGVPFFESEVVGIDALRRLADALYGDDDPTRHFYEGRPYRVRRENGSFVLSLQLPFTSKDEIALSRHADELLVEVGAWRRNLVLPQVLVEAEVQNAQFEDHTLNIRFAAPSRARSRR